MKYVVVEQFGDVDQLKIHETPLPDPSPGHLRVRLTSIGMNHAELMARRGEYKLSSGETPFTPGLEGGGIVDAAGPDMDQAEWIGKRVILTADAPRRAGAGGSVTDASDQHSAGTYRTHFITTPDKLLPAPDRLPDDELGTLWLAYLTAWGCLIWKQGLRKGQSVAISAASSSVGLAASQIVKAHGAIPIGLTTSQRKAEILKNMPEAQFDHIIVTNDENRQMRRWHRDILAITNGKGADIFFDSVGGGEYLDTELRALADRGTIWVYGLQGGKGPVDVGPIIRKRASIRGWILGELLTDGGPAVQEGYNEILSGIQDRRYTMVIAQKFALDDVQTAHSEMEKGSHIGKLVLVP